MNSLVQRPDKALSRRSAFKLAPVAVGCAALLLVTASAYAQQADTSLGVVTVTGIRAAIESAISVKKGSDAIVEAISAEDLGKLPDTSIADSIARLPGVAAQRNWEGRASQVSVRGMPPDFSTTLLNGREVVNPNDGRGAEFDAYPTELINGVVLFKTPDAALMGQGISGTIDLQTVRPLNVNGQKISFGLNAQQNSIGLGPTGAGNNFSFSYIDQNKEKTLGFAIGVARQKGDSTGRAVNSFDDSGTFADGTKIALQKSVTEATQQSTFTRDGVMAVLEFKPSKNYSSTLDLFSSKTDRRSLGHQVAFPNFNGGTLSGATIVDGVALAGTVSGVQGIVQTIGQQQNDDNLAIGWNNKFKIDANWSGVVDLSRSTSKRAETDLDSNAVTGNKGTLTFDSRTSIPTFGFTGDNLADPSKLLLGDTPWGKGWLKKPTIDDTLNSLRVEFKRNLENAYFSAVDFGLNYSDRTKVLGMTEGSVDFKSGASTAALPTSSAINAGISNISILGWDPIALIDSVYKYTDMGDQSWARMKNWSVAEKVLTTFAKLDIETSIGGIPVRGNAGVQIVKTDQSSVGLTSTTVATWGNPEGNRYVINEQGNQSGGKSYTDVLPSLNLVFDVDSNQAVRLGVGKMLARPTMRDLRANAVLECWSPSDGSYSPTSCNGNHSGSGGNPLLDPFRATTFDLAYEKYFGKRAYVAAAGFYKNLDTFIYQQSFKSNVLADKYGLTGYPTLDYTGPMNGEGGQIWGYELSASAPFDMLTPALSGFGAYVNYSDTHSSVNIPNSIGGSATKMELPGLSKQVLNLSAYYEKDGFSARVGQRTRSDFIGEFTSNEYERKLTYIKGEKIVDVQIGYEFKSGTAKGLSVVFQANNVNDAVFQKYRVNADGSQEITSSSQYGKNYMLGLNYKY